MKTMEELKTYWSWYGNKVSDFTSTLIKECMINPEMAIDNPTATLVALREFDNFPPHQCYWNDRFCIAVMCSLSPSYQRRTAWCAVSNAVNGYWEWITHSMFDTSIALRHIGIDCESRGRNDYCHLERDILKAIVGHFNLPTEYCGKPELTDDERRQRAIFNEIYPYTTVL